MSTTSTRRPLGVRLCFVM